MNQTLTQKISATKHVVLLTILMLFSQLIVAEGTKQWLPFPLTNGVALCVFNTADGNDRLGTLGCLPSERINIAISGNFATERIYIGMHAITPGTVAFRVMNPLGVQVYPVVPGLQAIPTGVQEGHIQSLAAVRNGPIEIFGAGGFDAISVTPTMAGNYYIEFNGNTSTTYANGGKRQISYFDVTVARTNGLPEGPGNHTAINGRLHAVQWALYNMIDGSGFADIDVEYFVYQTDDSLVTAVQWNQVRPGGWDIAFSRAGIYNTGNYFSDRQSKPYSIAPRGTVVGTYPIFWNDPDPSIFVSASTPPEIVFFEYNRCSGSTCFLYEITKGGQIEVLLDFNGNNVFDPGTSDVLLVDNQPAGVHCLPWDNQDGLGSAILSGQAQTTLKFQAGIIHMPMGDVEANPNGFTRTLVRPTFLGVNVGRIYYDHSLAGAPFLATDYDLDGCIGGCNIWPFNQGDGKYLNTWLSYAEILDTLIINFAGCDLDGDGLSDDLDIDDDNDGIPDIVETYNGDHDGDGTLDYEDPQFCPDVLQGVNGWNCANGLPDPSGDIDGDGIPNFRDPQFPTCGGTENGSCSKFDADHDGVPNSFDLDSDNDGIPDVVEFGGVDTNGDGFVDNFIDIDGDGLFDAYDNRLTDGPLGSSPCSPQPGCLRFTSTNKLLDSNQDGITDNRADQDRDGLPNYIDLDSDNDGIPDVVEALGTDVNGDGIIDNFVDVDRDGYNDVVDSDVNNDGVRENLANALLLTAADGNNDGRPDSYPMANNDRDAVPNFLDLDADNDGIADVVETGGVDANGDGLLDNYADSDRDGFDDTVDGAIITCTTTSITKSYKYYAVANGPGDVSVGNPTDALGPPLAGDFALLDSNGDIATLQLNESVPIGGTIFLYVGSPNGIANSNILFSTNGTTFSNPTAFVCNGAAMTVYSISVPIKTKAIRIIRTVNNNDVNLHGLHFIHTDATTITTCNVTSVGNPLLITGPDANSNGKADSYPRAFNNHDGNGFPNFLDLDADNDGIADVVEALGTDVNGDGRVDNYVDTDSDGFHDVVDGDIGNDGVAENTARVLIITSTDANNDGKPETYPRANADLDLVPNFLDLDADNDGIPDVVEAGGTDVNGDGRADNYVDTDNDGFNDRVDGDPTNALVPASDVAGANSTNALIRTGADTNNNGKPNSFPNGDADKDLKYNFLDLDADNDGIPDVVEAGGTDANGDGRADNYVDADNDGFNDRVDGDPTNALVPASDVAGANSTNALIRTGADTNNNGKPNSFPNGDADKDLKYNFLDLDADNDGIPDVVEAGGTDVNGDGRADNYVDADNDGFNDRVDGDPTNALALASDVAGANSTNALIRTGADTNNNGKPNSVPNGDADKDLKYNFLDLDADNDGIPDVVEAEGTDVNGDGRADNYVDADNDGFNDRVDGDPTNALALASDVAGTNSTNALIRTGADTNNNGKPNSFPNSDNDGDLKYNFLDLDADNDGIADVVESGGTDANGDGRADNYVDADNDGFNDRVDGDPTNVLALASDVAGANTPNALVRTGADTNNNGKPNSFPNSNKDGDLKYNFLDLDADNDGIADVVEALGTDANGDGRADNYVDADNDGFNDRVDGDPTNALALASDVAGANTLNALVLTGTDTDSDGKPNSYVTGDMDRDAVLNFLDLDVDADGIVDILEVGGIDADGNGQVDGYTDTDNDGWSENVDASGTVLIVTGPDGNNDGKADSYPTKNADAHGFPNFIDIDADNDGIVDNTEGQATIAYIAPAAVDTDGDGIDNAYDAIVGFGGRGVVPVNKDKLDEPDYLDLDTDNDGVSDLIEGHDTNGDGVADAGSLANNGIGGVLDIDNDGLLDGFDNNTASTIATNTALNPNSHPDVHNNKTRERDWREANSTYATNDINTTPINVTVTGNVLTNDIDLEGNTQALTALTVDTDGDGIPDGPVALGTPVSVAGVNENGTLAVNAGTLTQNSNGTYTFVPAPDFVGEVTYSYRVCDNGSPVACATATVTIDVEPAPGTENGELAPAPDWNVTHEGLPVSGQVLTNDNDPDGDVLTVTGPIDVDTNGDGIVDGTAPLGAPFSIAGVTVEGTPFLNAGTIVQNPNGTYTFSPVPGFIGVVKYLYTVCDNGIPMLCEKTTVTIQVLPALYNSTNAIDDEEFLDQGATLTANVLDNDYDVEGNNQVGGVTLVSGTSNGALTLNPDGSYTYTPTNPNFSGNDEFVYQVCDNGTPVECDIATVYITILPVDRDFGDGPVPYGVASHRAIKDSNSDNILDGASDIWLGTGTTFELVTKPVDVDDFDDAMELGTNTVGAFPRTVNPSTVYPVDVVLNSTSAATISYGMWIDWDNDGVYEDFYQATEGVAASGARTIVVNVASPAIVTTTLVNIRLRVHTSPLVFADFQGQKTNGEVEDYQFLMNDPLPVEMLYFNAKLQNKNTAVLDWATATELNNAGYDVEHALPTTGTPEFKKVGFVAGFGTTVNEQYYNYEVPNLIPGVHYFRLRQVDFDGTFTYTAVRALEVKGGLVKEVFPTILTESSSTVYIKVGEDANYQVEVVTALGQTVQSYNAKLSATSYHEVHFDLNQYASGVYFIRVSSDDTSFTTKIRVQ